MFTHTSNNARAPGRFQKKCAVTINATLMFFNGRRGVGPAATYEMRLSLNIGILRKTNSGRLPEAPRLPKRRRISVLDSGPDLLKEKDLHIHIFGLLRSLRTLLNGIPSALFPFSKQPAVFARFAAYGRRDSLKPFERFVESLESTFLVAERAPVIDGPP